MILDLNDGPWLYLHVCYCAFCGCETPHIETDLTDRCAACNTPTEEAPDAPTD